MGTFYQKIDISHFDYELYSMDGIEGISFRGPRIDRSLPYVACIGAAQTFGRFCTRPFTMTLADKLSMPVLNLGVGGAGPAFFLKKPILELINGAQLVIIQVLSGRSASCSVFDNSETGTLFGTYLNESKRVRFDQIISQMIADREINQLKKLIQEMQENYLETMVDLLQRISPPKLLFWFSKREPFYIPKYSSTYGLLGEYPHLIDEKIFNGISRYADFSVKVISQQGIPQKLWKADDPIIGTELVDGFLYNSIYPSQEMHEKAAETLYPFCERLLQSDLTGAAI